MWHIEITGQVPARRGTYDVYSHTPVWQSVPSKLFIYQKTKLALRGYRRLELSIFLVEMTMSVIQSGDQRPWLYSSCRRPTHDPSVCLWMSTGQAASAPSTSQQAQSSIQTQCPGVLRSSKPKSKKIWCQQGRQEEHTAVCRIWDLHMFLLFLHVSSDFCDPTSASQAGGILRIPVLLSLESTGIVLPGGGWAVPFCCSPITSILSPSNRVIMSNLTAAKGR